MRLLSSIIALAALSSIAVWAQSPEVPLQATPCQLFNEAAHFQGKLVQVRGIITRGFEDFTIHDVSVRLPALHLLDCGLIWLEPGGDGKGMHKYASINWQNEPDLLEWEHQNRIDSVRLANDDTYREMLERLRAFRSHTPDGAPCAGLDLCRLYKVTATITGRFFFAQKVKLADGRQVYQGFGHMGCCHLLVIQQVSEFQAERTAVPDEGDFICSTQSWMPTPEETVWLEDQSVCGGYCGSRQFFAKTAAHWGDHVDAAKGTDPLSSGEWISPDLTLKYMVFHEYPNKKDKRRQPKLVRIDRQECKAVRGSAPTP